MTANEHKEKDDLAKIGEPDRVEIVPGLVLEDKLRIKTQRRLEKHFNLPISRIFPGKADGEKWEGVNFEFLDNSIPLITILAQQVDDGIMEHDIEDIFDSVKNETLLAKNLQGFFEKLRPKDRPKNSQKPSLKRKK